MKRSPFTAFTIRLDASTRRLKAIFLIFLLPLFHPILGQDFSGLDHPGVAQIKEGMSEIASGSSQNGIYLLRKGRALLFENRSDPSIEPLILTSLLEEARGELQLAFTQQGLQGDLHREAAEKLLAAIEAEAPSLESHLLVLDLLEQQGKVEAALKKVDAWLAGANNPFEKGKYLFSKGKILSNNEELFKEALAAFEAAHFEGEEVLYIRLTLAKIAEQKGEMTAALQTLSKIVNTKCASPLIAEALNLRGELLEKIGRGDLNARQQDIPCGN